MSQTQDQHVFGSPTDNHLPNFLPRYVQLPDHSIQLSKLNAPTFNFVEVKGENSGLTDKNLALGLSFISRIPDSPLTEELEIDSGNSGQTPTLQGPNSVGDDVWHSALTWDQTTLGQNGIIMPNQDLQSLEVDLSTSKQELTQQYEADLDLSLYMSSGGEVEKAKTEAIPGYQPQSPYVPSQTSKFHPVLQPNHTGSSELLLPGRDKKYIPANTKQITSKNTLPDLSGGTQESLIIEPKPIATTRVNQNLERPGSIERRNIETVQSRVQNIRVKPLSKFVSSGHHLNFKPVFQQANSQISNPSQYATGPTAVGRDKNRWTSPQLPEHTGSNIEDRVPERTGFSTLKQEQGVHSVQVKSDQSAVIRLTNLSSNQKTHQQLVNPSTGQQQHKQKLAHLYTNQQGHQLKLVQSVAETGNLEGQESASTQRNVLQPTGRDEKQ